MKHKQPVWSRWNTKESTKEYKRQWYQANKERLKKRKVERTIELGVSVNALQVHKVTAEEYNDMLATQGGVCKICKEIPSIKSRGRVIDFHIDHNHETGQIRGLLCGRCNAGLGMFRDSIINLGNAMEYLIIHGSYAKR